MTILPEFLVALSFATVLHGVICHEDFKMKRNADLIQESSTEAKHSIQEDIQVEPYNKVHNLEKRQPDEVCANGPYKVGNDYQECGNKKPDCPEKTWCHQGESEKTTICCNNGAGDENPCSLNLNEGIGIEKYKRFFYDKDSDKCKFFKYKGTKGNSNMFLKKKDCKKKCVGGTVDSELQQVIKCETTTDSCSGNYCKLERRVILTKRSPSPVIKLELSCDEKGQGLFPSEASMCRIWSDYEMSQEELPFYMGYEHVIKMMKVTCLCREENCNTVAKLKKAHPNELDDDVFLGKPMKKPMEIIDNENHERKNETKKDMEEQTTMSFSCRLNVVIPIWITAIFVVVLNK